MEVDKANKKLYLNNLNINQLAILCKYVKALKNGRQNNTNKVTLLEEKKLEKLLDENNSRYRFYLIAETVVYKDKKRLITY